MKKICILFLLLLSCSKAEKPRSSFRVDLIDKETEYKIIYSTMLMEYGPKILKYQMIEYVGEVLMN